MASLNLSRMNSIDALRGFCLFALLMVHCSEYFELYWAGAQPASLVHDTVFFMFGGKAYAIFSLLFGVSFCIILESQAKKGIDFQWRFVWRLLILLGIGYLHGLLYLGDILTVLALAGLPVVLLAKLPPKLLWCIALVLICQMQLLIQLFCLQAGLPFAPEQPLHWQMMPQVYQSIIDKQSITGLFAINLWHGQYAKWVFMLESGRVANILGMALTGVLLWRQGVFSQMKQRFWLLLSGLTFLLWCLSHHVDLSQVFAPQSTMQSWLVTQWLSSLQNMLLTFCGIGIFILVYQKLATVKLMHWLANTGRMGLTVYVSQSLVGILVFYPLGLGLFEQMSQTNAILLGIVVFLIQMLLCNWWLNRYRYGPLEWLWRSATLMQKVPLKRHE